MIHKKSLAELLAEKKQKAAELKEQQKLESMNSVAEGRDAQDSPILPAPVEDHILHSPEEKNESFSLSIKLNKDQLLAKEPAFAGKSFCLTGAAGTGKTATQRGIARSLLEQNLLGTHDFRIQGSNGQRWTGPSIAFVAYTRIS